MTESDCRHYDSDEAGFGRLLLVLARNSIHRRLGEAELAEPGAPPTQHGASFVTLTRQGSLRGCIGSLSAWRPLAEDVTANAAAAAFLDPRFSPLSCAELPGLRIEVSLLTRAEPLWFASEEDALAQLQVGVDGLVLEAGHRRSTFLPQVWEMLPEPGEFLKQLKIKAGLAADYWRDDLRLSRYGVRKWKEEAGRDEQWRVLQDEAA